LSRLALRPPALAGLLLTAAVLALAASAHAADGEMRWGLHVTLAPKWLDPAETEAFSTPFMVLYAVHDALVKPMPGGLNTQSLAESWQESKDHLTYTFTLRKNARFHNGEPVTAEDVKFSFERYKGASAALLKEKVKDVQVLGPGQVRFVLKEPCGYTPASRSLRYHWPARPNSGLGAAPPRGYGPTMPGACLARMRRATTCSDPQRDANPCSVTTTF